MIERKFGLAAKYYRDLSGLSQEKFALSIGMDRTYYASIESGKRNPSLKNIEKIANGFNIPISTLFHKIEEL